MNIETLLDKLSRLTVDDARFPELRLFEDGSGTILDGKDFVVHSFNNLDELYEILDEAETP